MIDGRWIVVKGSGEGEECVPCMYIIILPPLVEMFVVPDEFVLVPFHVVIYIYIYML